MSQLSAVLIISLSLYCSTISTAAERDSNSDTTPSFTPVQVKGREKETAVVSNTATASTEEDNKEQDELVNDNEELINDLKDTAANDDEESNESDTNEDDGTDNAEAEYSLSSFIRFRPHILVRYVHRLVNQRLRNEPIVKMLAININNARILTLYRINGFTFRHSVITRIRMYNYNRARGNHLLAYRPSFPDYHKSSMGAVFVNIERLFPCIRRTRFQQPICRIFTNEEDGFNHGRSPVEAGDNGNNLNVFGGHYSTYAFGFRGCPTLSPRCFPTHYTATIVCHLPRAYCT